MNPYAVEILGVGLACWASHSPSSDVTLNSQSYRALVHILSSYVYSHSLGLPVAKKPGGRGLGNEKVVTYKLSNFADLPA